MRKKPVALWIEVKNVVGALRDVADVIARHNINISYIEQKGNGNYVYLYLELENVKDIAGILNDLKKLEVVRSITQVPTFYEVYGKRVIVIGGGAQVAEVAKGAISEADRHNIRGEKISVDTIPLVGEKEIAEAVRAVPRLPRARILILAGSLMGGEITKAVKEIQSQGIPVISLNMAGSVPEVADLVVSDPIQAGVMSVMAIADTAKFSLEKQRGKRY
ncbi:MAG TPA: ACT domain-containing protein [Candidatus Altiarchaeales archaeon]|nr:ACT domain-containing protein [Candidatus Altiarchaeales archaeon]